MQIFAPAKYEFYKTNRREEEKIQNSAVIALECILRNGIDSGLHLKVLSSSYGKMWKK